ncbi:nitrate ABC transporter permease [Sphaerisporangium krabiense]|uniref:ABC-type nitrate/sulfonate/bicarbonate transport system permease component n=1 Tax=Sphaerisporangium krabiense TaxID=763782 RepID=A0A7W8ZBP2_9ACTN|nr:ABC transporter permease [Sphaerisporangium krabiense]MBB5631054.1 ABC-type nitrate/sulfonate/bicarbonate transport system permease component [Sphaerisporangium krabiense]GII65937.1 nitrate ABC transporter permease [Sphaerisporangium krabiense]
MRRRLLGLAAEAWLPVAILLVWWFASASSTSAYFPSLRTIAVSFYDTWISDRMITDVLPSLGRFVAGFCVASIIGIALGTVLGTIPTLRRAVDPILDFFRSLPKPALLPIAIVALGVGDGMKIFIIAFSTLWPILLNTIDGVRGVDPLLLEMSRVYGIGRAQRVRRVVLPAASPQIFVGVRVSLSIGLILMVVSEMVASTNGLGYFVLLSQQTFAIPEMWAGIILLGVIGYLTNFLFVLAERRVLAWHKGWRATALGEAPPMPVPARTTTDTTPPAATA